MRSVLFAVATLCTFVFGSLASAQDDLDELMAADPEPPAEAAEAAEAPEESDATEDDGAGLSEEALSIADDERPPSDEPEEKTAPKETAEADAQGELPHPVSIGVLAGYGLSFDEGANPWTFGFGLRGGYNFSAFFLGGRFVYYVGETVSEERFGTLGERTFEDVSANLWELGVEAGYDIAVSTGLALRPGLGLGIASASGTSTEAVPFIAPGISLLYDVSETVFLGLDARYQAVMKDPTAASGLVMLANLGLRL